MLDEDSPSSATRAEPERIATLTAKVMEAYLRNNPLPEEELARLTAAVRAKFKKLAARPPLRQTPAVPIERSVTLETIICLECGLGLMNLKHHLKSAHGLTPAAYQARWGLPHDYPMQAPILSVVKSGIGRRRGRTRGGKPRK